MSENRRPASTQGRSFRGKNLRGKDFSHADIRGANFSRADLTGANFSHARAGIRPRWMIGLISGVLLLAAMSGLVIGFSGAIGAYLTGLSAKELIALQQRVLPWVAVGLLCLLLLLLFRRGLGAVLATFALALVFLTALVAILFPSPGSW